MSITSSFDAERKVIIMKIAGDINAQELVEGYEAIFDHESFEPNMHAIWDLSGLDLRRIPLSEVRQLPAGLRKYMDRRGDIYKAALVTTRRVDFELLRIYLTILKLIGTNIRFRLVRSMDDAYDWISR